MPATGSKFVLQGNACPTCGSPLALLVGGECGDLGAVRGRKRCDTVYLQLTGGTLPSWGGEQHELLEGRTYAEFAKTTKAGMN